MSTFYISINFTVINRTDRICKETCTINGITFPKGINVKIVVQQLHYSTEYWDEPDIFRPERYVYSDSVYRYIV